jgi:hypothetical protein
MSVATKKVRRVAYQGTPYLVAPASLIVPGVLNGSEGALFYPAEEARRNFRDWNGIPIVVYHPARNGHAVSASHPGVLEESGIGVLKNSRFEGKLVAEAWFDEEKTRRYDTKLAYQFQLHPRLLRGEPIELSTGLYLDREEQSGYCPETGRPYDAIAKNYRPDHLAILPDQRGACAISDGCGIVVNWIG